MTIRFQGQLDQTLYRRAQRINGARATTTLFTAFGLFVFAALFGFFLPWLGWTFLGLGVLALVLLALVEWQIRKNWKTHKLAQEPFQGALSEEGLELVAPHGSIKASWDRFHAWKGTASELLIYQSTALFHILARRFFASDDDWSAARALVAAKLPSRRAERRTTLWTAVLIWVVVFMVTILLWNALTAE